MANLIISNDDPIIINRSQKNIIASFNSTDSEDEYLKNKKSEGVNWYYYDNPIEYRYNSWGYRTKEFGDVANDYILVFGCSNTEGIALHYDDMWSTKLGKELNLDVFNLGMGGTGIDFQFYNTILLHNYIKEKNKPPKFVVYQWPSNHRTLAPFIYNQDIIDHIDIEIFSPNFELSKNRKDLNTFYNWYTYGFILQESQLQIQTGLYPMACNNIWKTMSIPVFNWTWEGDSKMSKNIFFKQDFDLMTFERYDLDNARDISHLGPKAQQFIVNKIVSQLRF